MKRIGKLTLALLFACLVTAAALSVNVLAKEPDTPKSVGARYTQLRLAPAVSPGPALTEHLTPRQKAGFILEPKAEQTADLGFIDESGNAPATGNAQEKTNFYPVIVVSLIAIVALLLLHYIRKG